AYFTYNTVACKANLRVNLSTTAALANVQLTAVPGGTCGGGGVMSGAGNNRDVDITITANTPSSNAGPCPITITWAVKNENPFPGAGGIACGNNFGGNNQCTSANYGGAIYVQRAFLAGDDASGPIR